MHTHSTPPHHKNRQPGKHVLRPQQKLSQKKKISLILTIFFMFWFVVLIVWLYSNIEQEPKSISLTKHIVTDGDADNDGVPDWLEILKGTNPDDATSFAYQSDIDDAIAKTTERQNGPSEITSDVLRRILYSQGDYKNITDEEIDHIVQDSVAHVTKKLEGRGSSDLVIQIDDSIDRSVAFSDFFSALQLFDTIKSPVERIVIGTIAKEEGRREEALQMQLVCQKVLQKLPKRIPQIIYTQYTLITKRISDSCAAVDVSLLPPTIDNVALSVRLLTSINKNIQEKGRAMGTDIFIQSLKDIVTELNK